MTFTSLAATTSWLLKPFALLLGLIFNGLFAVISGWTDAQALGISIILFTLFVRLLMTPLMYNQQRSSRRMTRLQPKIQKIQDKYKGKTDPESNQRMQAEIQALYKENKANPMSGCLPLLIQMPIIFALFEVLRNVPFYVNDIGKLYQTMATEVMNASGYSDYVTETFATVIKALKNFDAASLTSMEDLIYHLSSTQISDLVSALGLTGNTVFQTALEEANHINAFGVGVLTFNLCENPGFKGWNMFIPLVAGVTTFLQSWITMHANEQRQKMASPDGIADQSQKSMKMMNYIFPLMTIYFAVNMPAGLGLYWIASNVFGLASQLIMDSIIDQQEYKEALQHRDELIAKREAAMKEKSSLDKRTGGRLGAASNQQSKAALSGGNRQTKPAQAKPVINAEAKVVSEETAEKAAEAVEETTETAETAEAAETAEQAAEAESDAVTEEAEEVVEEAAASEVTETAAEVSEEAEEMEDQKEEPFE